MNRNALLIYLKNLVDLNMAKEKILLMINNEEYKYWNTREKIKNKPMKEFVSEPDEEYHFPILTFMFSLIFLCVSPGAFFTAWDEYNISGFDENIKGTILLGVCFLVIGLLGVIIPFKKSAKFHKENDEKKQKVKDYNEGVVASNKNLSVQKEQKIKDLDSKWAGFKNYYNKEIRKIDSLLQEGYSINVIPAPFRNFSSVLYIYEYMSTSNESLSNTLLHSHIEEGIQRIEMSLNNIIQQQADMICIARASAERQRVHNRAMEDNALRTLNSLKQLESNTATANEYARVAANYSKASAYFAAANYFK